MATNLTQGIIQKIENPIPSIVKTINGNWCDQRISYTNGGITMNYPTGLFSNAPIITTQVQLQTLTYSSDLMLSVIVTSNTSTSTTIRINKETVGGGIQEASTTDVYINIHSEE